MPPRGKLHLGSNIGIDKEQAYKDRIEELQKNQVREVPLLLIDEIENVRKSYDKDGIKQLAASIKEKGLLQPVILSERGNALRHPGRPSPRACLPASPARDNSFNNTAFCRVSCRDSADRKHSA